MNTCGYGFLEILHLSGQSPQSIHCKFFSISNCLQVLQNYLPYLISFPKFAQC